MEPLRLVERVERPVAKAEGVDEKAAQEPKALACYGTYMHLRGAEGTLEREVWLRFLDGRPVPEAACQYLGWCCGRLGELGKTAPLLVWDNAPWHTSRAVREWIARRNEQVRAEGEGVRILPRLLPSKSPWLNPIEPKWVHGKRRVAEPDGLLSADELERRVCACFGCVKQDHLTIPEKVA